VDLHPHGGGAENMYLIIIGYLDGKLWGHHHLTSGMIGVKWLPGCWAVTGEH